MAGAVTVLSLRIHKQISARFRLEAAFDVQPGVTAIFGPSGAGKTTLLDCVAGLSTPDSGSISIGGEWLFDSKKNIDLAPQQRCIGYVFQSLALFPHMNVRKNIEFGIQHLPVGELHLRADSLMHTFQIEHLESARTEQISGGERQRVAIARALAIQPRALVLDEPFTALDHATKSLIMADLRSWVAKNGIPVLFVTHAVEEVIAWAAHVVCMEAGRVTQSGPPHEILAEQRERLIAQLTYPGLYKNEFNQGGSGK